MIEALCAAAPGHAAVAGNIRGFRPQVYDRLCTICRTPEDESLGTRGHMRVHRKCKHACDAQC